MSSNSRKPGRWAQILADPFILPLSVALLVVLAAKTDWWMSAGTGRPSLAKLLAWDLLVVAGLWLVWAVLRQRFGGRLSVVLGALVGLGCAFFFWAEVVSLYGTGAPLHPTALVLFFTRTNDVARAGAAELGAVSSWLGLLLVAPTAVSTLLRIRWAPRKPPQMLIPLVVGLVGSLGLLFPSGDGRFSSYRTNVVVRLLQSGLNQESGVSLGAEISPQLQVPTSGHMAGGPDVVLIILESIGSDAATRETGDGPAMPFLAELGQNGVLLPRVRVIVPHTSKSLVSILCSQYPTRNSELIEAAANYPLTCLPHLLSAHGYRSYFLQSADGTFEQRPRLVEKMGFDDFGSWQDLEPPPPGLGYLASDDRALISPTVEWLSSSPQPAFVTVLTSTTHHPYELPSHLESELRARRAEHPEADYQATVQFADQWLEDLLDEMKQAGVLDSTIVVVVGDHGESFDGTSGSGHSNVGHDTVLNVPLVFSGPGVAGLVPGRGPYSLLDIVPTLTQLLGFSGEMEVVGQPVSQEAPNRIVISSSWFLDLWYHAVWLRGRLMWNPTTDYEEALVSPAENDPEGAVHRARAAIQHRRDGSHVEVSSADFPTREYFDGRWRCEGQVCTPTGASRTLAGRGTQLEPSAPIFASNRAVAHALGSVDGVANTNSEAAFEYNVQQGFRLFEVDFTLTEDGDLYCFQEGQEAALQWPDGAETLLAHAHFAGRFPVMRAERLVELLQNNPDVYLITDTTGELRPVLEALLERIDAVDPTLRDRLVPQLYEFEDLVSIRDLHDWRHLMLTMYQPEQVDPESIATFIEQEGIDALVVPHPIHDYRDLVRRLGRAGVAVYVQTINDRELVRATLWEGAWGIYTDSDTSLLGQTR